MRAIELAKEALRRVARSTEACRAELRRLREQPHTTSGHAFIVFQQEASFRENQGRSKNSNSMISMICSSPFELDQKAAERHSKQNSTICLVLKLGWNSCARVERVPHFQKLWMS